MLSQSKILINKGFNIVNGDLQQSTAKGIATAGSIYSRTINAIKSLPGTYYVTIIKNGKIVHKQTLLKK